MTAGETIVFDIGLTGLTASSLDFTSATGGEQGTFHVAAHVQGIGTEGGGSGWIGDTPEPGSLGLLAAGFLGLGIFGWRRSRR